MVSIPNYVAKYLQQFQHPTLKRVQYATHQWTRPNYGATKQLETLLDPSPTIPEEQKLLIQQIIGTLFYYARDVDCNIIPAFNRLAEQQSNPTKNDEYAITKFLDYAATNPSAIIQYKYIDMIFHIDSDAPYLSEPWARSRTGLHYCMRSLPTNP